jgi:hypothetical protein
MKREFVLSMFISLAMIARFGYWREGNRVKGRKQGQIRVALI